MIFLFTGDEAMVGEEVGALILLGILSPMKTDIIQVATSIYIPKMPAEN